MIELKDKNSLFIGSFKIVSKADQEITDRSDGSTSVYYRIGLSNGRNIVEVTCGAASPLLNLPIDQFFDMEFNLDESRNGKLNSISKN